ncbi:unnamed protein product [Dicrocoelium dendriticum]|nr:unnamed protein product [Dicrocoelium dendriticum]
MHYLNEEGYMDSAISLAKETNLDFRLYEVCDNIDLETILMEYESYYYVKFHKYPRITKRKQVANSIKAGKLKELVQGKKRQMLPVITSPKHPVSGLPKPQLLPGGKGAEVHDSIQKELCSAIDILAIEGRGDSSVSAKVQPTRDRSVNINNGDHATSEETNDGNDFLSMTFNLGIQKKTTCFRQPTDVRAIRNQETHLTAEESRSTLDQQCRLLKPLAGYAGYTNEWKELALIISREIFLQNPNVRWDDIIGLNSAKRLVKEAVVYPIKYPQLFAGILSPWKGLLLYGPPGTGKTLLAKAVATECNTTFFNISASSIVSKWRGDSEKLVRVLFELARFHAPSTIFLDELDSLMSQRGSIAGCGTTSGSSGLPVGGNEHEGSRRMKTELLMQMDGLAKSDDLVFLLAASNLPWELDHAMLRRLEKRILVDLPNKQARRRMFETFLPPVPSSNTPGFIQLVCHIDYDQAAELTEGYSGSDIRLVCKEAAMSVVRKIFDILESNTDKSQLQKHIRLDPITTEDVEAAIRSTMPSARQLVEKYQEWQRSYGSS